MNHSPRFLKIAEASRAQVREIDIHEVKKRIDQGNKFNLIDVREESEWVEGHLPGARHLGKGISWHPPSSGQTLASGERHL